uniref:Uncharacterized protein n=1 Tax=Neogobius melanostomus TaxID=47308 RepID=A0A8C6SGS1_9GOBI
MQDQGLNLNPTRISCKKPAPLSFGPALGLAWSNQLTARLMLRREAELLTCGDQSSAPRSLRVTFGPHLPDQSEGGVTVGVWRRAEGRGSTSGTH